MFEYKYTQKLKTEGYVGRFKGRGRVCGPWSILCLNLVQFK